MLARNSGNIHGTAAPAFIEKVAADIEGVTGYLQVVIDAFVKRYAGDAGGQVQRVAKRFGLIAAAGELAIRHEILPWPNNHPTEMAARCFQEWLLKRGVKGPVEIEQGITQIRHRIERDGSSRFELWRKEEKDNSKFERPTFETLGYVKSDDEEGQIFYIFVEGWKEICKGFNSDRLAKELVKRNVLKS